MQRGREKEVEPGLGGRLWRFVALFRTFCFFQFRFCNILFLLFFSHGQNYEMEGGSVGDRVSSLSYLHISHPFIPISFNLSKVGCGNGDVRCCKDMMEM